MPRKKAVVWLLLLFGISLLISVLLSMYAQLVELLQGLPSVTESDRLLVLGLTGAAIVVLLTASLLAVIGTKTPSTKSEPQELPSESYDRGTVRIRRFVRLQLDVVLSKLRQSERVEPPFWWDNKSDKNLGRTFTEQEIGDLRTLTRKIIRMNDFRQKEDPQWSLEKSACIDLCLKIIGEGNWLEEFWESNA